MIDITERKRNEEHIRFIMDELSRRSKNLLTVVLAIANRTVEHAMSFGEFQANFEGRLMALARSHDLLIERGWTGATIETLIFAQLKPFLDDPALRVDIEGPPITLAPQAAQNIGLAFHELATNAMKYGALSSPEGRIVIRWDVDDRQTPRKFRLSWHEQGGPHVNPPTHEGLATGFLAIRHKDPLTPVSASCSRPKGSLGVWSAKRSYATRLPARSRRCVTRFSPWTRSLAPTLSESASRVLRRDQRGAEGGAPALPASL